MSTINLVLAMATQFGWTVNQMDVKGAFPTDNLQGEIYMSTLGFLGCRQ